MKSPDQRLTEARRQHTEAVIDRHVHELFQRLPFVCGFWLPPDLEVAELSVFSLSGGIAGWDCMTKWCSR